MTDKEERAYIRGETAAYRTILGECLRRFPEGKKESWRLERADAVAALRSLCDDLGWENDWADNTHLADVINSFPRP